MKRQQKNMKANKLIWSKFKDKESVTKDNKQVEICANIGSPEDMDSVINMVQRV